MKLIRYLLIFILIFIVMSIDDSRAANNNFKLNDYLSQSIAYNLFDSFINFAKNLTAFSFESSNFAIPISTAFMVYDLVKTVDTMYKISQSQTPEEFIKAVKYTPVAHLGWALQIFESLNDYDLFRDPLFDNLSMSLSNLNSFNNPFNDPFRDLSKNIDNSLNDPFRDPLKDFNNQLNDPFRDLSRNVNNSLNDPFRDPFKNLNPFNDINLRSWRFFYPSWGIDAFRINTFYF